MSQVALQSEISPIRWGLALPAMVIGAIIIAVIGKFSIEAAGIIYCIAFMGIMFTRPELGLMIIFMTAPFPNDIAPLGSVKFSIADFSLILATIALFVRVGARSRRIRFGPLMVPIAIYLLVCISSSFLHWNSSVVVRTFFQMIIYFFCAIVVFASIVDRKDRLMPIFYGLMCSAVFLSIMLVFTGSQYILGLHKNSVGSTLSIGTIVAVELWFSATDRSRRRLMTVFLMLIGTGLIFTLSRGSWMSTVVGCSIIVMLRRQYGLLFKLLIISIPVLVLCFIVIPESSQSKAFDLSLSRHSTAQARINVIEASWEVFKDNPILGIGLGYRKQIDATNIVMVTLAETGILGLVTFMLIHVVFLWVVWWTLKRLRRDDPLFTLVVIGTAVLFGKLTHGLVDHYWSRGIFTVVWACVGMVMLAYLTVKQREKLGLNR